MSPNRPPRSPAPNLRRRPHVLTNEDARKSGADPLASDDIIIIEDDPPAALSLPPPPAAGRRGRRPPGRPASRSGRLPGVRSAPAAAVAAVAPAPGRRRNRSRSPPVTASGTTKPAHEGGTCHDGRRAASSAPDPAPAGPVLKPERSAPCRSPTGGSSGGLRAAAAGRPVRGSGRPRDRDAGRRPRIFVRGTPGMRCFMGSARMAMTRRATVHGVDLRAGRRAS